MVVIYPYQFQSSKNYLPKPEKPVPKGKKDISETNDYWCGKVLWFAIVSGDGSKALIMSASLCRIEFDLAV